MSEDLSERANSFGIVLDDVALTHLTFGLEFTSAVEQKQVAQQEAERARFIVEKVRIDFSLKLMRECTCYYRLFVYGNMLLQTHNTSAFMSS